MRVIYVAHQLGHGPDREANRRAAAVWAGWIAETFGVAISADWIVLSGVWDESKSEMGLATDLEMVSRSDEVWQVGPRVSPGMALEGEHARRLGKVVRDFTGLWREQIIRAMSVHETGCSCPECEDDHADDDGDRGGCPGCGGNCQVACR